MWSCFRCCVRTSLSSLGSSTPRYTCYPHIFAASHQKTRHNSSNPRPRPRTDKMTEPPVVHQQMGRVKPPQSVLAGFNLDASQASDVEFLPGGANTCYVHRPSNTVLKPTDDIHDTEILSNIVSQLDALGPNTHFRVSKPLRSTAGTFVYEGWSASAFIPDARALGRERKEYTTARFEAIVQASRAFHDALGSVQLTDDEIQYLRYSVNHVWAQAHRAAWSDITDTETLLAPFSLNASKDKTHPYNNLVRRFIELGHTLGTAPSQNQHLYKTHPQIIHGDLASGNNMLFHMSTFTDNTTPTSLSPPPPAPPPAIIDLSPTYAPAGYAEGIVVADMLIWCHFGLEVLYIAGQPTPERLDMLRRGLMFRCLSSVGLLEGGYDGARGDLDSIERVVGSLEEFVKNMEHSEQ